MLAVERSLYQIEALLTILSFWVFREVAQLKVQKVKYINQVLACLYSAAGAGVTGL